MLWQLIDERNNEKLKKAQEPTLVALLDSAKKKYVDHSL